MTDITFITSLKMDLYYIEKLILLVNSQTNNKWSIHNLKTTDALHFVTFECSTSTINHIYPLFYIFIYHYKDCIIDLSFENYRFEINKQNSIASLTEEIELLNQLLFDNAHYFVILRNYQSSKNNFTSFVDKYFKIGIYAENNSKF